MNISDQPSPYDDTEAHAIGFSKADAERTEGDDTEAHGLRGP